jgi:hypothetical protein
LVERLLYTQDVGGSSPSPPTRVRRKTAADAAKRKTAGQERIALSLPFLSPEGPVLSLDRKSSVFDVTEQKRL